MSSVLAPGSLLLQLPDFRQSICELGKECVVDVGVLLNEREIDRLRVGPLCLVHWLHVAQTIRPAAWMRPTGYVVTRRGSRFEKWTATNEALLYFRFTGGQPMADEWRPL